MRLWSITCNTGFAVGLQYASLADRGSGSCVG
jgi:hypothetical protein